MAPRNGGWSLKILEAAVFEGTPHGGFLGAPEDSELLEEQAQVVRATPGTGSAADTVPVQHQSKKELG